MTTLQKVFADAFAATAARKVMRQQRRYMTARNARRLGKR